MFLSTFCYGCLNVVVFVTVRFCASTTCHKPVDPILWRIWQPKLASVGLCHCGTISRRFLMMSGFVSVVCLSAVVSFSHGLDKPGETAHPPPDCEVSPETLEKRQRHRLPFVSVSTLSPRNQGLVFGHRRREESQRGRVHPG